MLNKYIFFISLFLLVVFWFIATTFNWIDPLFLPSPKDILNSGKELFLEKEYLNDIVISVFRVFTAFLLSLILAIPTAVLIINYKFFENLISPYIDFIRYLPVPSLIPISILFFGLGESAKIALLFIGTYFQLVLLIVDNLKNVPKEFYDIAYTLNFSKLRTIKMQLKSSLPEIYDNGRITLGWCWTYLVIAELVGAESGIGHMIKEAYRFSNTSDVYFGILTMGVIGFITDYIFKKMYSKFFKYKLHLQKDD